MVPTAGKKASTKHTAIQLLNEPDEQRISVPIVPDFSEPTTTPTRVYALFFLNLIRSAQTPQPYHQAIQSLALCLTLCLCLSLFFLVFHP
jgi:hypothetical protein